MKIILDIEKIKGKFKYKDPLRIKFKLGDFLNIWTEYTTYNNQTYPFLEKHQISFPQQSHEAYIQITLIAENGDILAQITVFLDKFKQFKKIQIKAENQVYILYYSLKQVAQSHQQRYSRRRISKIQQQPPNMNQQSSKLQILRLGVLMYNFAQRLDPLVVIYNSTVSFLTWKQPLKTMFIAIFLSLAIYYTKISIFIAGLFLFFSKDIIFKKISTIHRYRNVHKRIIVPKQNALLLQQIMDTWCVIYQNISAFLFNDDKTMLINLINFVCKTFVIIILLLFLFNVQTLTIISIWVILLMGSPMKKQIIHKLKPILSYLLGQYDKIYQKVTSGISNIIGNTMNLSQIQIKKQFYFYHYQRWWVIKGWRDQSKKYSDQNYQTILIPRQKAPQGWAWVQQWKISFEGQVDSEGYQYANDIISQFKSQIGIPIRRRRKWKRTCIKLRQN